MTISTLVLLGVLCRASVLSAVMTYKGGLARASMIFESTFTPLLLRKSLHARAANMGIAL